MKPTYIVHCDGAAAPSNPGPSSAGIVIESPDKVISELSVFLGYGTNQTAELTAALLGLQSTPVGSNVLLVSDSMYVLKGLTEWRKGWEERGWRNSCKKPVANRGLWERLFLEYDVRSVECKWVKGHSGHDLNERCDELATEALTREASRLKL